MSVSLVTGYLAARVYGFGCTAVCKFRAGLCGVCGHVRGTAELTVKIRVRRGNRNLAKPLWHLALPLRYDQTDRCDRSLTALLRQSAVPGLVPSRVPGLAEFRAETFVTVRELFSRHGT